jgi:ketosteroid isomerase-like protein
MRFIYPFVFLFSFLQLSISQGSENQAEMAVMASIAKLSKATSPGGGGADAYADILTEDYSRWTLGSDSSQNKYDWVEGIREWFDDGWRVTDRQTSKFFFSSKGDLAFTRRVVSESYIGPGGEKSSGKAAVSEVWRKEGEVYLLWRVDISPIKE